MLYVYNELIMNERLRTDVKRDSTVTNVHDLRNKLIAILLAKCSI